MLVINLNNNRSRKMAWMQEHQWDWWIIHTDSFADTQPVFESTIVGIFKRPTISLGQWHRPQGPPFKYMS